MKKLFFFLAISLFFACSSGDLEKPSFDFSDTINQCNDNTVLFKLGTDDSKEALIITLEASDLPNEVTTATDLPISGNRSVTYRIFDSKADASYFCQNVPPLEPRVIKNWEATNGFITIETIAVKDNEGNVTNELEHIITFINLVLSSNGEILNFDFLDFGSIKTTIPGS